jgi:hypothetical protein
MASAAWHLRDIVRRSRWYLGGSQRFLPAGITWFQHWHVHLPAGGARCGHDHDILGMSNKVQFRSSSPAARTSKRRVGWFGFMSQLPTAGWAAPTPPPASLRPNPRPLICVVVVGSALPVTPLRTPAGANCRAIAGGPGAQIRRVCSFALFTDKVTVRSSGAGHREPALGRWPSRQGDRGQGRLARSPCGEGPGCQLRSRCIYAP